MLATTTLHLLAAANEGGVWYGTPQDEVGLAGWLTVALVATTIAVLCWLANWAVKRSVSGEEASSRNRDQVRRLVDGMLQTWRQ